MSNVLLNFSLYNNYIQIDSHTNHSSPYNKSFSIYRGGGIEKTNIKVIQSETGEDVMSAPLLQEDP